MGEILGVGITHYPSLLGPPDRYANLLRRCLESPLIPDEMKQPSSWPAPMQDEWNNELERATVYQERLSTAFKKVRKAIDDFKPDAVVIFGDDQYENFREDIIPPFNVFAYDEFTSQPFHQYGLEENNAWGLPGDTTFTYPGNRDLAKHIASELIKRDFPIPYSYKDLHAERGIGHAFANSFVFLDWEQRGFPYPIVPIQVNCYGKDVIRSRGAISHLNPKTRELPFADEDAPPGPTARSCFRLGQMVRQIVEERPERIVIMASSSWSHAFLVPKNHWIWPDLPADKRHVDQLRAGEHAQWADITNDEIDDGGLQEFKNWICLAGAMEDRQADVVDYVETHIFASNKCFALFPG